MIRHVVVLTFHPGTDHAVRREIVDRLRQLPAQIPEIVGYHVGSDLGIDSNPGDLAITADFENAAGYTSYRDHPVHTEIIATLIRPVLAERSAMQFQLDGAD